MEPSLLSQAVWLELPLATRAKLAQLFEFPDKGSVLTRVGAYGTEVISDGYGYDALKLISLEKLKELLNSKSDNFYFLFGELIENLDDLTSEKTMVIEEIKIEIPLEEPLNEPTRRGRPKKA